MRLDVVGDLWGTLETRRWTPIVDLNETGALLRSPMPLPPNSLHSVEITREDDPLTTKVRVCHLRPGPLGSFLVGVQFFVSGRNACENSENRLATQP